MRLIRIGWKDWAMAELLADTKASFGTVLSQITHAAIQIYWDRGPYGAG